MKTMKKVIFFVFSIAFANIPTHCFYNDGNNMWRGAAIGGLAGGRRGAAIGLGVGAMTDVAGSAAADSRRRRYYDDDDYYYEKRRKYISSKNRRSKPSYEELQQRNAELEDRLAEYENR
jgi:hypothetical protein